MSGIGAAGNILPPLPKSLSDAKLDVGGETSLSDRSREPEARRPTGGRRRPAPSPPPPPPPAPKQAPPPPPRKQTKLDVQLARLRKEMYKLRELDLSVLSQLWSLNEALQEFRSLQEMMSPSSDMEEDAVGLSDAPTYQPRSLSSSSSSCNSPFTTEL